MAKRVTTKTGTKAQPTVYCANCAFFVRDTEGISRRQDTGEYFMGICSNGLHPDSERKQFADKPRNCKLYRSNG